MNGLLNGVVELSICKPLIVPLLPVMPDGNALLHGISTVLIQAAGSGIGLLGDHFIFRGAISPIELFRFLHQSFTDSSPLKGVVHGNETELADMVIRNSRASHSRQPIVTDTTPNATARVGMTILQPAAVEFIEIRTQPQVAKETGTPAAPRGQPDQFRSNPVNRVDFRDMGLFLRGRDASFR